jgi:hypothetical protein
MKTSSPAETSFLQMLLKRAGHWASRATVHRAADLAAIVAASGNPSGT